MLVLATALSHTVFKHKTRMHHWGLPNDRLWNQDACLHFLLTYFVRATLTMPCHSLFRSWFDSLSSFVLNYHLCSSTVAQPCFCLWLCWMQMLSSLCHALMINMNSELYELYQSPRHHAKHWTQITLASPHNEDEEDWIGSLLQAFLTRLPIIFLSMFKNQNSVDV